MTPPCQGITDFDAAPGVPMDRRPARKRKFEREQKAHHRAELMPVLHEDAAPRSPIPECDDGVVDHDFFGDDGFVEDQEGGLHAAPPRARGRGRGPAAPGGADVVHAVGVGDAAALLGPRGRGAGSRRGRGRGGLAAPRGSQQTPWGRPQWTIARTTLGWGADCRCHVNLWDLPTTTHCKNNIPIGKVDPNTDDETRRLCKVWLLVGDEFEASDGCRDLHVRINPRAHYKHLSEAELDPIAAQLG